ncbi:uncharacterized protein LTHEOB_6461 [Neofusicoccum parvum]|nr:uncharacterized protein LTHEOB_6461 [Neofusicoccum parvum]
MPRLRSTSTSSFTSTDSEYSLTPHSRTVAVNPLDSDLENDDEQGAHDDTPGASNNPDDAPSTDDNAETGWQPPRPQDLRVFGDSAQRLLAFQAMPSEAQTRVVELHLQHNHTVEQAINAVVTERRHNLLALPVQAREAYVASVRLVLTQVDERVFDQAIALHVLIQALPQRQSTIGHRLLRMVANDPRDIKGLIGAHSFASDNLGNNPMISRLLNDMADSAFTFHHNDDELRSLHQYDRHQALPEPRPLSGPPDGMVAAHHLLENERCIVERVDVYREHLHEYQNSLSLWINVICASCMHNRGDHTADTLLIMQELWQSNPHTTVPDILNDILKSGIDRSAWNNPETCDPTSILLGPFTMMCFGIMGRPDYSLLNSLIEWEDWDLASPAREARDAANQMLEMWNRGATYLKEAKEVLKRELRDHGRSFFDVPTVLAALENAEPDDFGEHVALIDPHQVPATLLSRMSTVEMLWSMCSDLSSLSRVTSRLGNTLDEAKVPDMDFAKGMPMFPVWARAYRREYFVDRLSEFREHHANASQDLKDIVASCRHPRARTLMLSAFPPGAPPNIERVRDIAVAARVEQTIRDSAEMLWHQEQDLSAATALLSRMDIKHLNALRALPADSIYAIINDAHTTHRSLHHTLVQTGLPSTPTINLAAIGPALRATSPSLAPSIPTTLTTAALSPALRDLHHILANRRTAPWPLWIAPADATRMAANLLRALYLAHSRPTDRALVLTRHSWTHGLHRAWLAWHLRLRTLLRPVVDHLTPDADARLAWNIACDQDWEGVEAALRAVPGGVEVGLRRRVGAHLEGGRRLRAATDLWVGAPDVVDPLVLPGDFGEGVRGGREEVLARMHGLARFEGFVVDGGRLVSREWV